MPAPDPKSPANDLSIALDALAQGVLIADGADPLRKLVFANAAAARITGFEARELVGQSLMSLAGPDSDPVVGQQLREAILGAQSCNVEWVVHRRDGSPLWTRISVRPVDESTRSDLRLFVTIEDISDHRRVRDSLRSSEARLDLAIESGELCMWDWNVARDEVYYNDRWRWVLGIDPQELLARTHLSERLMLPDDAPELLQRFEQHYNGVTSAFEAEYSLPARDGSPRWFLARARVVRRDSTGKALRMVGVLRDVSRSRQELRNAQEVELRWERAVRGTSDGLYDWNLLTGHVWYASRFRETVGYEAADFPDTFIAFQNVLHSEDRSLVMGKIRAHLENQDRLDIRCRIVHRSGEVRWCRLRGQAERDAAGRPARLSGSLTDISDQIDAEDALTRSQDFYGTVLDALPLLIAYIDRQQRLVYANRSGQQFFDLSLADSRGREIKDAIGELRYASIADAVARALNGELTEVQGRFRDAYGREAHLDAALIPHRDEAGAIQGCFITARDVTEKRQLEAELRQSQKMEAVGRLTGGIAHDFNNLLSVIVGNTQLLARALRESPRLLRQSETALNAAMRGAELTRRLLAFARQQVLEPRSVDLNELIAGMYELLRRTLTGDIELRQKLGHGLWASRADPGQLENAVLNLVINARDAMPAGGVITISTRNASLGADRAAWEEPLQPGDYAVLEVSDTGHGMSPETLKRVFEPFFTTKDVGKGSGLGLAMVYGFVKQSGGQVHIRSELGRGTTVHVYFPRTQASVEKAAFEHDGEEDLPRGEETVLVVEDNVEVRTTVVDLLGSLGYRVLEAANGYQALERFMQHPDIALVFSDIMLPGGLLGSQLVQKLSERRPGLKVLLTSAFSESTIMQRGVLDGSVELLQKPYKVEDLARRIRAKLDVKEENQRVPA
jgi:PAS domain S-box-containing protein